MNKLKAFFKSILLIFFYFILSAIILSSITSISKKLSFNNLFNDLFRTFGNLFILIIFIIIFRKKIIPDFHDFKKNYKKYISIGFRYWLLGLFLMYFSEIIISLFVDITSNNQDLNIKALYESPISSITAMIICAPIIEELIIRKSFRDVFDNQIIYIIVSSLIFGGLHLLTAQSLLEILYIIPYSALGAVFAKLYYDTDNIWSNIAYHSIHNTLATILILIGGFL